MKISKPEYWDHFVSKFAKKGEGIQLNFSPKCSRKISKESEKVSISAFSMKIYSDRWPSWVNYRGRSPLREAKEGQEHFPMVPNNKVQRDFHQEKNWQVPKGLSPIIPINEIRTGILPREKMTSSKSTITRKPSSNIMDITEQWYLKGEANHLQRLSK